MTWNYIRTHARPALAISWIVLLLACSPEQPADHHDTASVNTIAFVNVNVIPMTRDEVLRSQTVVIENGEVVQIGAVSETEIPPHAQRVDGQGKYLMPGLADMHAHVGFGFDPENPEQQADLLVYLASGVTTIRNAVGSPALLALEQAVEDGEITGPRMATASPLLEGENAVWDFATKVLTAEEARAAVRQFAEDGFKTVKIYHTLSPEAYKAVVEETRARGMTFFGHVPFEIGVEEVLADGQRSIEHLRGYDIDGLPLEALEKDGGRSPERFGSWLNMSDARMDQLVQATVDAGTWNCPTFAVNSMLIRADELESFAEHPMARYMPADLVQRFRESGLEELFSVESREMLATVRPQMLTFLRKLHEAGAPLMTGTDTFPSLVPGFTVIDEIATFVEAGLTPYEALQYSTVYPARFIGAGDERGTIEVGQTTDLILLGENPLQDIENLWKLEGVLVGGNWTTQGELLARLETAGEPEPADILISNVSIIPMTGPDVLHNHSVLVSDGKIVDVGPSETLVTADPAVEIDGKGKYLLPGLVDMHSHITGPETLTLNLAHGVTTVRNMWGTPEILDLQARVASGDLLGPEIESVSPVIDNDPPSMTGMTLLTDPADADALVADFKARGYRGLKTYRLLTEEVYESLAVAADKYDMTIEGHIPEAISVSHAIELGHDVVEHATGIAAEIVDDDIPYSPAFWSREMVDLAARVDAGELTWEQAFLRDRLRALARLAATNETAVSVTFQAVGLRALTSSDRQALRSHPQILYLEPAYEDYWFVNDMSSVLPGDLQLTDEEIASLRPYVTTEFGNWIRILSEEGVLLLGGTDAPNPGLFHGYSLHDELKNFVTWAGLSPKQAIETVTTNAARYWDRTGEIGVIAKGAEADLLLLSANPLDDIRNTLAIEGIAIDGQWLDRAQLDEMLEDVATRFAAAGNE